MKMFSSLFKGTLDTDVMAGVVNQHVFFGKFYVIEWHNMLQTRVNSLK